MALSVEEMEVLLRMAIHATASLPDLSPAARVESEAAIDAEARRAIVGPPNRLGDPAVPDAFEWSEKPAAEDVAEELRFGIGGHFDAYDYAIPGAQGSIRACRAGHPLEADVSCDAGPGNRGECMAAVSSGPGM